ncbi:ISKra4 family transposase [Nostoc sp. LEGE 12450]|uniref:ISKra4 family transposase n=1 Tax=Nostoc sp. LEGE 12450 TaxID=1828643 RepID=UPI0018823B83|nr:ISKra4 family transposase [Nostoc sp. LEGE 12450]MBE8989167.1 ISKra4 family transposase [Nostoc sp. LEGE 12450]
MNNLQSILSHISDTLQNLPECHQLEGFVSEFYSIWLKLGNFVQQSLFQALIEEKEAEYSHPRTKREKRYYTPLGEMVLVRRAYETTDGIKVKVDEELGLPKDKWLPMVLELACALGVSSEFPNSHSLFQKWTTLNLTQKTLANLVEKVGNQLQSQEFQVECDMDLSSQLSGDNLESEPEDLLYVGVDGVMTPLNQKQGYKEAKVGVIFWNKHHEKVGKKRGVIRQREYVATLKSRLEFRERVSQLYNQVAGKKPTKTVFLGDGAHWIWAMASEKFPGSVEILDFFHLSEYVWAVAKAAYPNKEDTQKDWVKTQQQLLKKSQWTTVIENCHQFQKKKKDLSKAITNLERYLTNNQSRIDYRSYLKAGLMIGSGVVESSNRRVVTQRLKQAGMHWSCFGAEGVMALRAAYLSSSSRWSNFWSSLSYNHSKLA